jgi:hypothetical protein
MIQDFPLLVYSNKVNIVRFLNLEVKKEEILLEEINLQKNKVK